MPSRRHRSLMGVSRRKPSRMMRIFSSALCLRRVRRLISLINCFVPCVLASACQNCSVICCTMASSLRSFECYFFTRLGASLKLSGTYCLKSVPLMLTIYNGGTRYRGADGRLAPNPNREKPWYCQRSPTGAHHWIIIAQEGRCKYCRAVQDLLMSTPSFTPKRGRQS